MVNLHAGVGGGGLCRAGPLEGVAGEEHVPDQGLDRRLADQPDKE